jgi:hypothetical protein
MAETTFFYGTVVESGSFFILLHDDLNANFALAGFDGLCSTFKSIT